MPLFNVSKMMATYTTDFGSTANNVAVKLTTEAPIPTGFYADRPTGINCSSAGSLYTPRRLVATFDFGIHEYPVDSIANIPARVTALEAAGAICIDLVGEKWVNVPSTLITNPNFISTPYPTGDGSDNTAVDGTNDKQVGSYDYTSDLTALGTVSLRYNIETRPSAVATAQLSCLANAVQGEASFCSASVLGIKPRYFVIKAAVDGGRTMSRQAKVSDNTDLATCGGDLSSVAFCLGYQGESIKGIHNLI